MSFAAALGTAADAFLVNTDKAYTECDHGISEIERIIISQPSAHSDRTRTYMVPLLYAYWERFFRICFAEYIRGLETVRIPMKECRILLSQHRVRKELLGLAQTLGVGQMWDCSEKATADELRNIYRDFSNWLNGPLVFADPSAWVQTDSNVRLKVLEKNCKLFGIETKNIEAKMKGKLSLFQGLEELVDARNTIAHGAAFAPISSTQWLDLRTFVGELQNALQLELYECLRDENRCIEAHPPLVDTRKMRTMGDYWQGPGP